MVFRSWLDLKNNCPINIERVIVHAVDFDSYVNVRISINNLEKAKNSLILARGELNLMVGCLIQTLRDKSILINEPDRILFRWLIDNCNLLLKYLDDQEKMLVIDGDKPYDRINNRIGVGRLTSYSNLLNNICELVIYETILKTIQEYNEFEETEDILKNSRTFLYILFEILEVTLSSSFGLKRDKGAGFKKGTVDSLPTQWTSLIRNSNSEQRVSQDSNGKESRVLNPPEELIDNIKIYESEEDEND